MKQLDPKYRWKYFLHGSVSLFFLLIVFIVSPFLFAAGGGAPIAFKVWLPLWLAILAAFGLLWFAALWTWRLFKYELREEGFRKESGIIWKSYNTIPYSRIQNIDIRRGVADRLLGLSSLLIQTAGTGALHHREGVLPGLSTEEAGALRDELIKRVNAAKASGQGL